MSAALIVKRGHARIVVNQPGALSDADLALQVRTGSQEASRLLVQRYAAAAVNLAGRLVHDRALAEDLAQEAFVRAFARLGQYDPARRFSSWFLQIVHHVVVDYIRRRRLETVPLAEAFQAPGPPGAAASPLANLERVELSGELAQALAALRPEYRAAVVLRFQEGLGHAEIAEVLGVPVGTVKTYLHRGRREMADWLTARGWKPSGGRTG
ncbi:MAG: RNA polymerase sigma factor [Vicinamibacterales bacterium]